LAEFSVCVLSSPAEAQAGTTNIIVVTFFTCKWAS
jgi:hypothetical protein